MRRVNILWDIGDWTKGDQLALWAGDLFRDSLNTVLDAFGGIVGDLYTP